MAFSVHPLLFVREVLTSNSPDSCFVRQAMLLNPVSYIFIPEGEWTGWAGNENRIEVQCHYKFAQDHCFGQDLETDMFSSFWRPSRESFYCSQYDIIQATENALSFSCMPSLVNRARPFWILPDSAMEPTQHTCWIDMCIQTSSQSPDFLSYLDFYRCNFEPDKAERNQQKAEECLQTAKQNHFTRGRYIPCVYSEGNVPCVLHLVRRQGFFFRKSSVFQANVYFSDRVERIESGTSFYREIHGEKRNRRGTIARVVER